MAQAHFPDRIRTLIAQEIDAYIPRARDQIAHGDGRSLSVDWHRKTLAEFQSALVEPAPLEVIFRGGVEMECWSVTRTNGCYRVVYLPMADYFSLVVESKFGPVDINVHGDALGCFGSV